MAVLIKIRIAELAPTLSGALENIQKDRVGDGLGLNHSLEKALLATAVAPSGLADGSPLVGTVGPIPT